MPWLGSNYISGYPIEYPAGESWDMAFELVASTTITGPKWQQPPNENLPGLHAHDSALERIILADQWQCSGGRISGFQWYGNYELDPFGGEIRGSGIEKFHLSLHNNRPATPWCLPFDPEIWGVDVPFSDVGEVFTGLVNSEGSRIYLYKYDLPQPIDQTQGEIYWVDISAMSLDPMDPPYWRWQENGRNMTPIICPAAEKTDPPPSPWQSIGWANMTWTDLAFDVMSVFFGELYVKWSQPPESYTPQNAFNGWDEYSVYGGDQIAADDWFCDTDAPVTDIHWWGSFIRWDQQDPPELPDSFHFTIWKDGICTDPNTGMVFSCPSEVVWEADYNTTEITWEFVGWDFDPRGAAPEATFKFSLDLDAADWFYQDTGDNIYWLSIAATYASGVDPEYPFGWKTRPRDPNSSAPDDAVRIFDPVEPHVGDPLGRAEPIYWPDPAFSWDLAFELTTQGTPPAYEKWSQPPTVNPQYPEYFYGWNEPSVWAWTQIVADDWKCDDHRSISDIHWWGSYAAWMELQPPPNAPGGFRIGLWTDVPVGDPNNQFTFSHPGRLIRTWQVTRDKLNERPVGVDFYPPALMETCFRYDYAIPHSQWFRQPNREEIFWISIAAEYPVGVPIENVWGWKTRQPHWNDDAVRVFDPTAPLIGSVFVFGEPIETFEGSWDMAFVLTTPICPGDANCDGEVDFGDINPFVDAMLCVGTPDPPACWYALYPDCSWWNNDVNEDSAVTFGDINPFVFILTTQPLPVLCP